MRYRRPSDNTIHIKNRRIYVREIELDCSSPRLTLALHPLFRFSIYFAIHIFIPRRLDIYRLVINRPESHLAKNESSRFRYRRPAGRPNRIQIIFMGKDKIIVRADSEAEK